MTADQIILAILGVVALVTLFGYLKSLGE